MAKKQKGGLGRGLNALFDTSDANTNARKTIETLEPTEEKGKKEEVAPAEMATSEAKVAVEQETPVEEKPAAKKDASTQKATASKKKPQEPFSDIYISEDALENAKVVEREARPAKAKETKAEPKPEAKAKAKPSVTPEPQKVEPAKKAEPKTPWFEEVGTTVDLPMSLIEPNPDQPRTSFKKEEIEELANSIERDGLLQPILVRKRGQGYQIIAGERRYQACKSLGMKTIPARYWVADEGKALELALIENVQRSDLNPIEEAYGYKRLMERKGMTQSEVAQTVSKGRSTIANALRLLDLPEEAQQMLFEERITAGHARAILSIPSLEGRKQLTNKLLNQSMSVRETESLARLIAGREEAVERGAAKRSPAPAIFKKTAKSLTKLLATPVRVKTVQGKNKIEIQFENEEELQRIFEAILHTGE